MPWVYKKTHPIILKFWCAQKTGTQGQFSRPMAPYSPLRPFMISFHSLARPTISRVAVSLRRKSKVFFIWWHVLWSEASPNAPLQFQFFRNWVTLTSTLHWICKISFYFKKGLDIEGSVSPNSAVKKLGHVERKYRTRMRLWKQLHVHVLVRHTSVLNI